MSSLTDHEKYLQGIPLSRELEEIQRTGGGELPKPDLPQLPEAEEELDDVNRELTRSERLALKELLASPGAKVMLRLWEKLFQIHEKGAIARSQTDPLGNKDTIASEWAYVTMFRRAQGEIRALMLAEVAQLQPKKKEKGKDGK